MLPKFTRDHYFHFILEVLYKADFYKDNSPA